jgi:ribosomal protein L29
MAKLNAKEIRKMSKEDREKKFHELELEIVKSRVNASKTGSSKVKEIKKLIARMITINKEPKNVNIGGKK